MKKTDSSQVKNTSHTKRLHSCSRKKGGEDEWNTMSFEEGDPETRDMLLKRIARLEEENKRLRYSNNSLRISRDKYRSIFENAPFGIFRSTLDGRYIQVNKTFAKKLGYQTPEDVVEGVLDIGNDIFSQPGRRDEILEIIKKHPGYISFENEFKKRDGTRLVVLLYVRIVEDEEGAPLFIEGMFEDITDRKTMEEELRKAREMAEEANRAKGIFLANVSHEIRTPINGIIGALKMLSDSGLKSNQQKILNIVDNSAGWLKILINDLLDFSKIEAGKFELIPIDFDLPEMLKKTINAFTLEAEKKHLDLSLDYSPDIPKRVHGDPDRFGQILRNLIGNAIKFTENGSIQVKAELLEAVGNNLAIRFSVSDTGIGIPEKEIPKLFKSFSQLDGPFTKKFHGTGLGLAISRKLTEIMGGEIWVESKEHIGSTFFFTIRFRRALNTGRAKPQPSNFQEPLPRMKILLAEDNLLSRKSCVHILERKGMDVTAVTNGIEVLAALQKERFDLVLMDVQMPEMDGMQATREIRGANIRGIDPSIPVIALTAFAMKGDKEKFLSVGMDGYISKPMDIENLFSIIRTVLGKKSDLSDAQDKKIPSNDISQARSEATEIFDFIRRFEHQEDLLKELTRNFISEASLTMKELSEALVRDDVEKVKDSAHSMINITGFIKLYSLVEKSRKIESAARNADLPTAGSIFLMLRPELEKTIEILKTKL